MKVTYFQEKKVSALVKERREGKGSDWREMVWEIRKMKKKKFYISS